MILPAMSTFQILIIIIALVLLIVVESKQNDHCVDEFCPFELTEKELAELRRYNFTTEDHQIIQQNATYKDLWGFEVNWRDHENGWSPFRRYWIWNFEKTKKNQMNKVKQFTTCGYKVMDIPKPLFEFIKEHIDEKSAKPEKCDDL